MGLKAGDLDGQVVAYNGNPDWEVEVGVQPVVTGRCACREWPVSPRGADSEGRVGRCEFCGVGIQIQAGG